MKVEDVVEGLNRYVEDCRQLLNIKNKSFFVMRKNMQVNSSFKAYKSINETLYLVDGDSKEVVVDETHWISWYKLKKIHQPPITAIHAKTFC